MRMSDYCTETTLLQGRIEQLERALCDIEHQADRDRAQRTLVHLRARVKELRVGTRAPAWQSKVQTRPARWLIK